MKLASDYKDDTSLKVGEADWVGVLNALENPKYKWRTLRGIAKALGSTEEQVREVINDHLIFIQINRELTESNEVLFTTRRHYRNNNSAFKRIIDTLKY